MSPNQVEIVEVCRRQLHALSLCGGSEIEAMAVRDATVAPPAPDRVIRYPSIPRQLFDEGLHTPILANLASKSRGIRVAISRMAVSPELGDKLAMAASLGLDALAKIARMPSTAAHAARRAR